VKTNGHPAEDFPRLQSAGLAATCAMHFPIGGN